jgi:hypothetical protein
MALEIVFCKTFASPWGAEFSGLSGLLNFFEKTRHQNDIESRKCWSQNGQEYRTHTRSNTYIYIQYETYLIIDHHRYHLSDLATICQIP